MTQRTDEKKPTGSTNPPAGRTDAAIVPRGIRRINQASPKARRIARAGAALAVLATACSPAYAQPADRGTIAPKPRGPVIETTISEAVAAPTEKRGFVSSEFSRCRHSGIGMVSGGMGLPARMAARLLACS